MRLKRSIRQTHGKKPALYGGISPTEAARYLNISQSGLYSLMQRGQLSSRRVNGMRVISHSALMDYRARHRNLLNDW